MKKLDRAAASVIFAVALLLAGVIWVGNHLPVEVRCTNLNDSRQISPRGGLIFEFSRPVKADLVPDLWRVHPAAEGKWEKLDERRMRWLANGPLPYGVEISLQFVPGVVGMYGETIDKIHRWQVSIRNPKIVVSANPKSGGQELYVMEAKASASLRQLTNTGGKLYNYAPAPDGEKIAFSVINNEKGIDLWMIERDGSGQRKILDCKADRCSSPTWSPDESELAYTRESTGLSKDSPMGAPRIWILDLQSLKNSPLFDEAQKIGYGSNWSPDGKWISIWNGAEGGILVANRQSGQTNLFASSGGDTGTWSTDSRYLYYVNILKSKTAYRSVALRADIEKGSAQTILGSSAEYEESSIGGPLPALADEKIVVTIQKDVKKVDLGLFLVDPNSGERTTIMDDKSKLPGNYSWSPDGQSLLFQADLMGKQSNTVETWIWERHSGDLLKVSEGTRFPKWLP